jgi:hypothetical protein
MKTSKRKSRTILFFIAMLLCLSSAILYNSLAGKPDNPSTYFAPRSPISGQETSLDQVRELPGMNITLPSTLGTYSELKVDKFTNTTTIIYSSNRPDSSATIYDVINQKGIILQESPNTLSIKNANQNLLDAINATKDDAGALHPASINEWFGCAGGNVGHSITWNTNETHYELMSNINYPLDQLVIIAKSITSEKS